MPIRSLRIAARFLVHPVLIGALGCVASSRMVRADEPPRPPAGEVRLASGRAVNFTIHHDRNSLRDSLRNGFDLIALTSSGTLLRFELPTVRLARERIGVERASCIGRGEGDSVLAGLSDGRICRVDRETLELTEIARLPDEPVWLAWRLAQGARPAGLVAVTRRTRPVVREGRPWDLPFSEVHDLAAGKTLTLDDEATTFLLDSRGRVWAGADRGEWGGRVTCVDLARGTISELKPPPARKPDEESFWHGVFGFVELRDGQVWAFGGTSHMGFNSAFITRVDEGQARPLQFFETPEADDRKPEPVRPLMPITHIVEEGDSVVVLSYSDVLRADKALKFWRKVATLEIHYRWGRPDAVGSYPSVCAITPLPKAVGQYALATIADGYLLLDGPKVSPRGLPGQLGASSVARIANSSEGTLFFEDDDRLLPWRLGPQGWETASLAPPVEPDPGNGLGELEGDEKQWYETRVLLDPRGAIFTVSGTGFSDGTRTTARRVAGKSERIGRETSSLSPGSSFLTADDTLWNVSSKELLRFEKGRWQSVCPLPEGSSFMVLEPLNANGPPWMLLDRFDHALWRLVHGPTGQDPRLAQEDVEETAKKLVIHDAVAAPDGSLLLATDAGLRSYALSTRKLSRPDFPEPARAATVLIRDGLGRLWLGGSDGLRLSEHGAKTAEPFDGVPWIGRNAVRALASDPDHADGVIVSLGERGVMFVRARQGAR